MSNAQIIFQLVNGHLVFCRIHFAAHVITTPVGYSRLMPARSSGRRSFHNS
jgi:hypothetical protein